MAPKTAREIIDAFGGTRALGDLLGRPRNVVSQWLRIGIPPKYWPELSRRAAEGIATESITIEVLERHVPSEARTPEAV